VSQVHNPDLALAILRWKSFKLFPLRSAAVRIQGLGLWVWGLGCGGWGVGVGVWGLGCGGWGAGRETVAVRRLGGNVNDVLRVEGRGFRVEG